MSTGREPTSAARALGAGPLDQPDDPRRPGRRRVVVWALAATLAVAGVAVSATVLLDRKSEREGRQQAEQRRMVLAELGRLRRVQAPHRAAAAELLPPSGATPGRLLAARTALLTEARRSILLDARSRARRGEIEGPIAAVTCGPLTSDPGSLSDERVLERKVGRYDCIAVQRSDVPGVALGQPFVAALDFERFTYVWCRDSPPPSERGEALAFVRLDRACLAARGKALGTGYASTPEDDAR